MEEIGLFAFGTLDMFIFCIFAWRAWVSRTGEYPSIELKELGRIGFGWSICWFSWILFNEMEEEEEEEEDSWTELEKMLLDEVEEEKGITFALNSSIFWRGKPGYKTQRKSLFVLFCFLNKQTTTTKKK